MLAVPSWQLAPDQGEAIGIPMEHTRQKLKTLGTVLLLGLVLVCPLAIGATTAASGAQQLVMGTDYDDGTISGRWMRRIYGEAFKRLGLSLDIVIASTKRLSALSDDGSIDGEFLRIHGYATAHPGLVRVEESPFSVLFALYTADPQLRLERLEDLRGSRASGEYRRGVLVCENSLKPLLPAERLADVNTTEQGLKKLLARRSDFLCDIDVAVQNELASADFKGTKGIRKLLDLGSPLPLYPYLQKKHADLAPRLAATLKQMKAEGLIERYRVDAERELGAGR